MDEFEITLVSNGSMDIHPDNTMAKFCNILPEHLTLKGDWKVALAEIIYPSRILNVSHDQRYHVHRNIDSLFSTLLPNWRGDYYANTLAAGRYVSATDILEGLSGHSPVIVRGKTNKNGQIALTYTTNHAFSFETPLIPYILGFDHHALFSDHPGDLGTFEQNRETLPWEAKGKYQIDITGGRNLLFVYTDIVEPQVGDTKTSALRLLPLNQSTKDFKLYDKGMTNHQEPNELHFKQVLKHTITRISIELRDEAGRLIPFESSGRTAIVLKFKKFS